MPHPSQTLRRYFRHGLFPQLMVFEAVARLGSVTRAAEELHLAQPTVSTQIKKLSEALGLTLFEQRGRQLHLTAAVPGARHLAARLLSAFCVRYPGVQATLQLADRAEILERLGACEDEILLLQVPDDRLGLALHPVAVEPLLLYARANHPLAKQRRIPLPSLANEAFVLRESGSSLRELTLATFVACGVRLVVRAELSNNEAIAQAVAQGVGLALLPEGAAQAFVDSGAIAPLDAQGFPLRREWGIGYAKGGQRSPSAALFVREALSGELLGPLGPTQVLRSRSSDRDRHLLAP
jgi:DNA-binding transcriptional LysR family regulator